MCFVRISALLFIEKGICANVFSLIIMGQSYKKIGLYANVWVKNVNKT